MPRFAGVPVQPDTPQEPRRPRFAGTPAQAPPDVGNVTAGSQSTEAYAPTDPRVAAERAADRERYAPTRGMGPAALQQAGFFKSLVDTAQGAGQAFVENSAGNLSALDAGLRSVGLAPAADLIGRTVGAPVAQAVRDTRQTVDATRERDAPLMATGHGLAGNVAGHVTQLLAPGVALRGTAAGRALLPATVRGNALQGAALGAIQPVASGEGRGANAALGAAAGAALPGALKTAGAAGGAVRNALRSPTERAEREAVRTIQREVGESGLARLARANPSAVPGATRTLFEETQLPGVARLETRSRGAQATNWAARDVAENQARVQALQAFAGDESALAAAETQRARGTAGLRNAAFAEGDEAQRLAAEAGFSAEANRQALREQITGLMQAQGGRSTVKRALQDVLNDLDDAEPTVRGLYNVRKSINDLIEGKAGSEKGYARAATAQLLEARGLLDTEIATLAPSFQQYLGEFQRLSGPVNRMQLGQALLDKGSGGIMDEAGNYVLQPGLYGRAVKGLDKLAQRATGFKGADGLQVLGPEAAADMAAVGDDLARQSRRIPYGSGPGQSHTASQLALGERIGQAADRVVRLVPYLGDALVGGRAMLRAQNAERLSLALETVLRNPAEYRRVAAQLAPADAALLEQTLVRLGTTGATSAAVPALTQ